MVCCGMKIGGYHTICLSRDWSATILVLLKQMSRACIMFPVYQVKILCKLWLSVCGTKRTNCKTRSYRDTFLRRLSCCENDTFAALKKSVHINRIWLPAIEKKTIIYNIHNMPYCVLWPCYVSVLMCVWPQVKVNLSDHSPFSCKS